MCYGSISKFTYQEEVFVGFLCELCFGVCYMYAMMTI